MNKCLFYTFNFKVYKYVLNSVNSFFANNTNYDVRLFAYNFSDEQREQFVNSVKSKFADKNIEIIFKEVTNDTKIRGVFKHIQGLLNEKFKLLYELKKDYDLIIYSDPDVIFRKSVEPIEEYVSKDPGLYATAEGENISAAHVHCIRQMLKLKKYFNCGFLVLNSDIKEFSQAAFDKVNEILSVKNECSEQNYMNYYYNIKELKNNHNYIFTNDLCLDAISVHYKDTYKPWNLSRETGPNDVVFKKYYVNICHYFGDYFKYKIF